MNNINDLGRTSMIIGILLAGLLLVVSVNSTYFFLGVLKVKTIEWVVFNACVPSNLAYIVGFMIFLITKDKTALGVGILPMVFFGTMGLFIFPWGGTGIIAQISHIIMTLNVIWALYVAIRTSDYKALSIGLLIGLIIYVPFIAFQQYYARTHVEAMQKVLQIK